MLIKRGKAILGVSSGYHAFTGDLVEYYPLDSDKITIIHRAFSTNVLLSDVQVIDEPIISPDPAWVNDALILAFELPPNNYIGFAFIELCKHLESRGFSIYTEDIRRRLIAGDTFWVSGREIVRNVVIRFKKNSPVVFPITEGNEFTPYRLACCMLAAHFDGRLYQ